MESPIMKDAASIATKTNPEWVITFLFVFFL
jgi:hypothetical protein